MVKRIALIGAVCAFVVVLAFVGCSSSKSSSGSSTEQSGEVQQASQAEQSAAAEEAEYVVTIDGCELASDYKGNPAVIVTYTFTNNSDDATSFMVAISAKCFQNGVQLDGAIGTGADSSKSMSEIKPGATITVQEAYELNDQSDVSVECSELFSFDDVLLAEATFSLSAA